MGTKSPGSGREAFQLIAHGTTRVCGNTAPAPHSMNTSVPVVLLACGFGGKDVLAGYGALGVARTLGRLGIPVYLVSDRGTFPIASSRYWKDTFTWDLSVPVDRSLRFLLDVGRRVGSLPILLPTTDRTAVFVAEHGGVLGEGFTFPKVSPAQVRSLTNKWQMFLGAKANGIPAPETIFPHSRDDIVDFLDGARFPVMLKGADPLLCKGTTKEIINNARDLLERYDRAAAAGSPNLIIQEYIPGDDQTVWMCNAYFDRNSECLATFTGRKIRQWPPHAGIATLGVCQANSVVEAATRHFMKAVGYRGLVEVEYRCDARDGLYKVLDVNPRVSGAFRLSSATNGTDVVRVYYLDQTGQAVPSSAPSNGRKWMVEEDIFSAFRYAREGKLTLRQWVGSLRGVEETHWFAPDDPLPILVWCWKTLCAAARRLPMILRRLGRSRDSTKRPGEAADSRPSPRRASPGWGEEVDGHPTTMLEPGDHEVTHALAALGRPGDAGDGPRP